MSRYRPPHRYSGGSNFIDRLRNYQRRIGPVATGVIILIVAILIFGLVRAIVNADLGRATAIVIGRGLGLVLGFTLHEWAHAFSAYRLGGYAALPDRGRLSLDPRVHIDAIGVVLALVAGFGWAKPVPVNPAAFYPNERRDMLTVAFAGPFMNLLIAFVVAIMLRIMLAGGVIEEIFPGSNIVMGTNDVYNFLYRIISTVVFFNILLFLFNLIPLFPLDGWRVLLGILSPYQAAELRRHEQTNMIILYLLIVLSLVTTSFSPIFAILGPPLDALFELFTGFRYFA